MSGVRRWRAAVLVSKREQADRSIVFMEVSFGSDTWQPHDELLDGHLAKLLLDLLAFGHACLPRDPADVDLARRHPANQRRVLLTDDVDVEALTVRGDPKVVGLEPPACGVRGEIRARSHATERR